MFPWDLRTILRLKGDVHVREIRADRDRKNPEIEQEKGHIEERGRGVGQGDTNLDPGAQVIDPTGRKNLEGGRIAKSVKPVKNCKNFSNNVCYEFHEFFLF